MDFFDVGLIVIVVISIFISMAVNAAKQKTRQIISTMTASLVRKSVVAASGGVKKYVLHFLRDDGTEVELTTDETVYNDISEGDEGTVTYKDTEFIEISTQQKEPQPTRLETARQELKEREYCNCGLSFAEGEKRCSFCGTRIRRK